MSRFVRPETRVLKISDGDTLIVKRRLTSGEQRAAYARMYRASVDGSLKVDPLQTGIGMITAYLLDWSLTDDEGVRVVIAGLDLDAVSSALDALDQDSFVEIKAAIEQHEQDMLTERAAAKKIRDGAIESAATSPSPSAVAGVSTGSAI